MNEHEVINVGTMTLDVEAHAVTLDGKPVKLSRMEFQLLQYLMRNPGTVLERPTIYEHVWGGEVNTLTNTVDVHIGFLRRKLGAKGRNLIETVYGYGYKLAGSA